MLTATPTLAGRFFTLVALVFAGPFTVTGATEITVDTAIDVDANDGFCSLREAILAADSNLPYKECPAGSGPDRIAFDLSLPATILLGNHLPVITESLVIIGPGATELSLDGDSQYRPLAFDTPGNNGTLYVADLTVTRGRSPVGALAGGGAYIAEGELAVFRRVRLIDNRAEHAGGGLGIDSGAGDSSSSVTLLDCLLANNVAEEFPGGGGLYAAGTGSVVWIVGTTFFGNHAEHDGAAGGGLHTTSATLTVEASTVSGNSAHFGGGIYASASSTAEGILAVRSSTITENSTGGGEGGGVHAVSGPEPLHLILENSVVAGNLTATSSPDLYCDAFRQSSGWNFVGSNEGCEIHFPAGLPNLFGDYVGSPTAPILPGLELLADNGGPTFTHRPFSTSPLIDQGSCLGAAADQRGFGDPATGLRPVDVPGAGIVGGDHCDIGAVEVLAAEGVNSLLFADGFELGHALLWSDH